MNDVPPSRNLAILANRFVYFCSRWWFFFVMGVLWIYAGLPMLAPVLMAAHLEPLGRAIYSIYAYICNQLPQRSFFLFGTRSMYSLAEIRQSWLDTIDPSVLRQFLGDPVRGWKFAWSDRMTWMYSSIPFFASIWWVFRKRTRPISVFQFVLFLIPMAIDGGTHMLSDQAGLGLGFRDSNAWLAVLTHNGLRQGFYQGDAWGSFNAWMRFLTGVLFGLAIVWYMFPYMNDYFLEKRQIVEKRFMKAGISLFISGRPNRNL
jgi:uncharacterized membrane protein